MVHIISFFLFLEFIASLHPSLPHCQTLHWARCISEKARADGILFLNQTSSFISRCFYFTDIMSGYNLMILIWHDMIWSNWQLYHWRQSVLFAFRTTPNKSIMAIMAGICRGNGSWKESRRVYVSVWWSRLNAQVLTTVECPKKQSCEVQG